MTLKISFQNKFVLVTGATRGIGASVAIEILACGGNVIVTGTSQESPSWLAEFTEKKTNQIVDYSQIDFAEDGWIEHLDGIIDRFPEISVCINNAAINIVADIRHVKIEELRKINEVNLIAPAIITSKIAPGMAERGYGRIVNISSIFGIGSRAGRSSYSASKAGLIGQTRAVALDLAEDGVLVNAVCPGITATDLTRRVLGEQGMLEVAERIPLKRLATVDDIVPPVLFLASNLNTYITGQVLVVDGGYLVG